MTLTETQTTVQDAPAEAVESRGEPIIVADHVWKQFRTSAPRSSLRNEALDLVRRMLGVAKEPPKEAIPPFWALQDINFKVYKGESVAIVGHNGAGKSTLFRVLCGVTEPTEGSVTVNGMFAPLLALGAGFNQELSGRQNIYLNAAIQGMTAKKTDEILDEIIGFADIGPFIDAPVKRYSSGMTARLGFSIAVHTLPDIVFLDEIIGVGDASFQRKCRARIRRFKDEGRTIMFVSHSSTDVRALCERTIWLNQGKMVLDGPTDYVLDSYENYFKLPNSRQRAKLMLQEDDEGTPVKDVPRLG